MEQQTTAALRTVVTFMKLFFANGFLKVLFRGAAHLIVPLAAFAGKLTSKAYVVWRIRVLDQGARGFILVLEGRTELFQRAASTFLAGMGSSFDVFSSQLDIECSIRPRLCAQTSKREQTSTSCIACHDPAVPSRAGRKGWKMAEKQSKGREMNDASPGGKPDASTSEDAVRRTGRKARKAAGPDGSDARVVGDTFKKPPSAS